MPRFLAWLFRGGRDVPLGGDASSRFLPWITGLMVYLAVVALAMTMVLADAGEAWRHDLTGTLTVQVMPDVDGGKRSLDVRTRAATELLLATPGITAARVLTDDQIAALLAPWLGRGAMAAGLPLPRLIDVALDADVRVDTAALGARLAAAVPGASLDDHALWLDRLLELIGAIEVVAVVALALIGLAGITIVVFTTRSGLAIHEDVVAVLHIIGARDSYIARQFQAHVLGLALKGGVVGFAFAAATIAAVGALTAGAGETPMPDMSLSPRQWGVLGALPVIAACVGMATARLTVMRAIGRMT
jgi:cell division transport system permease protein